MRVIGQALSPRFPWCISKHKHMIRRFVITPFDSLVFYSVEPNFIANQNCSFRICNRFLRIFHFHFALNLQVAAILWHSFYFFFSQNWVRWIGDCVSAICDLTINDCTPTSYSYFTLKQSAHACTHSFVDYISEQTKWEEKIQHQYKLWGLHKWINGWLGTHQKVKKKQQT